MGDRDQDLAIGIDLGTTYCCVAVFCRGSVEVIANDQGSRITPSTVGFTSRERLVGEGAQFQRMLDPTNVIYNSKRFIGRKFDDPVVQENKIKYPFKFREKDNKVSFQVSHLNKTLDISPEEVGAALLEKMKKTVEDYLGAPVKDAVVTVPAYFTDSQRGATKDAGKIAGLNVLRIINEPTAAALAYGLDRKISGGKDPDNYKVLVYDLGGGTFDVSLLEIDSSGYIAVQATSGNTILGGEDFTQRIVQFFKDEIKRKFPRLGALDLKAERRLTNAAEKAKLELSGHNRTEAVIDLEGLLPGGGDFKSKITRAKFEMLCQGLFLSTIETVKKVLEDGKTDKDDVDEVILVGGSTRIPRVRKLLRDYFTKSRHNTSINPDEAVACGAAVQAALLKGVNHPSLEDFFLIDVNPLSLGMDLLGGVTQVVIERNSALPVKKAFRGVSPYSYNNPWTVRTTVVEGERPLAKDNNILGEFYLHNIPPGPAGSHDFDNEFSLDVDGILTVTTTHVQTGRRHSLTLDSRTSGRMTKEEVNKVISRAERNREADERETKRVLAFTALKICCQEIKFELSEQLRADGDSKALMDKAVDCLEWLKQNKEASEAVYRKKLKEMETESGKCFAVNRNSYGAMKHSFEECDRKGEKSLRASNFPQAYVWFSKASKIAGHQQPQKVFETAVKLGLVCRGYVEEKMRNNNMKGNITKIRKFIKQGANHLVTALKFQAKLQGVDLAAELWKMKELFDQFLHQFPRYEQELEAREFLKHLSDLEDSKSESARELLRGALVQYLHLAKVVVERPLKTGLVSDVKESILVLDHLQGNIERLARLEIDSYSKEIKAKEFRESFDSIRSGLQAIKIPADVEDVMKGIKSDLDISEKIDEAMILLDEIKQAKHLSGYEGKFLCRIVLVEGKIFQNLLDNETRARLCYKEVIDIAQTQGYTNLKWYREAKELVQLIETKEESKKHDDDGKSKAEIIEMLSAELELLGKAAKLSLLEFIEFLFENFPPKHNQNAKKPDMKDCNDRLKKRAYYQLCSYYHPDRIDAAKHGLKYKVLCEEITKKINEKFV